MIYAGTGSMHGSPVGFTGAMYSSITDGDRLQVARRSSSWWRWLGMGGEAGVGGGYISAVGLVGRDMAFVCKT